MAPREKKRNTSRKQAQSKHKKATNIKRGANKGFTCETDEKRPKRIVAPPRYYQQDVDEEDYLRRAIKQSLKDQSKSAGKVKEAQVPPVSNDIEVNKTVQRTAPHQGRSHSKPKISQQKLKATMLKANESISRAKAMKQRRLKSLVQKPKTEPVKVKPGRARNTTTEDTKKGKPAVIPSVDDFINYVIQSNVCTPEPRLRALFEDGIPPDLKSEGKDKKDAPELLVTPVKSEKALLNKVKLKTDGESESRTTRSKNCKAI